MIFLILTSLGVAALLLSELNSRPAARSQVESLTKTRGALREAKEALIGAATAGVLPALGDVRPGQLPWPDRSADPGRYDGRSDCVAPGVFNESHLLGQFPSLGEASLVVGGPNACLFVSAVVSLQAQVHDGTGAPLWYAVSRNLVNPGGGPLVPINPDIVDFPPFPWLRVCDAAGALISDRVAAVILAPGAPLPGQDRSGNTPNAAQFLEGLPMVDAGGNATAISNADADGDAEDLVSLMGPGECREGKPAPPQVLAGEEFVRSAERTVNGAVVFNDQLVFITADEIVHAVQKQAINAVAHALGNYRNQYGRYPWLSPFADVSDAATDSVPASPLLEGAATGGSATSLEDSGKPFDFDATVVGAAVRNLRDGSTAMVEAVASATLLTLTPLIGGMDNQFEAGDEYEIATFRGAAGVLPGTGTREGQLPFHDPLFAEDRVTDFSVDWELKATDGAAVTVTPQPDEAAPYKTALTAFAESSQYTGPVIVGNVPGAIGLQRGVCRTAGPGNVRCQGIAQRQPYLLGAALSASPTLLEIQNVVDAPSGPFNFGPWGIRPGDRVFNQTDGSRGVVTALGFGPDADQVTVARLEGGTLDTFTAGDVVSVAPAAKIYTGQAQVDDTTTLTDAARAVLFGAIPVQVDDVVFNQTDGSYGLVEAVAGATLRVSALVGGADNRFEVNDQYQVRSAFVERRTMTFDLYYTGAPTAGALLTQKSVAARVGSRGAPAPIAEPPTPTPPDGLPYVDAAIHIEDFDLAASRVGEAFVRIDGDTTGYILTDRIERDFDVGPTAEIPPWIVDNGWHEFLYMAVAGPMSQAGVGNCATPGTCIGVHHGRNNLVANPARDDTDVEAVVIGAGVAFGPGRPSAVLSDYFEDENDQTGAAAGDDQFEDFAVNPPAPGFNDRLMIVR